MKTYYYNICESHDKDIPAVMLISTLPDVLDENDSGSGLSPLGNYLCNNGFCEEIESVFDIMKPFDETKFILDLQELGVQMIKSTALSF